MFSSETLVGMKSELCDAQLKFRPPVASYVGYDEPR